MEKISRQQKRKLHRDMGKNKWYVKDWQPMEFIRTDNDATREGLVDIYANDLYTCITRTDNPRVTWLSIKRNDLAPIHNWQHLQHIKNDICGAEREAVELYPAMSRIVDTANQYHLWVLPAGHTLDVGFKDRLVKI
jgi:hypothetical protein